MKRIFVGSSTEGIEKAHHICEVLKTPGEVECDLWTSFFEVGLLTFEALESMLLTCCAAVFVATPDDESQIRGKNVKTPRSNVMLEFGLVAGRLGRTSIALCQYGGAELPSDLAGLTKIDMDLCRVGATQLELEEFRRGAEEKLRKWSSSLLATIDAVPRTEIVHGYTGRWEFNLHLEKWRNLIFSSPSFAEVNGALDLILSPNGQVGRGFTHGRLFYKWIQDEKICQGEYRSSHSITNALCHIDGSIDFTTEAFVLQKANVTGVAPLELADLAFAPEPWVSRWRLVPTQEPRMLAGTVRSETAVTTEGKVKLTKLAEGV
jgi:hypothetical protein